MFNKAAKANPASRADSPAGPVEITRRVAAPRAPSLLGPDIAFEGSISGEGELHVDGCLKGDVKVQRLIVGEHAVIEGMVRAEFIEVRGKVIGNIEGRSVKLFENAYVEGDITHEQLSIEVGAFFQGRCQQAKRPPALIAQAV